jgi:uroporphyrin-III C-methyltransferase
VSRLGSLRKKLWEEDNKLIHALADDLDGEDDDVCQPASFNQLIKPEDIEAARDRRMRWLSQICEYWPLKRLASITDEDVATILTSYSSTCSSQTTSSLEPTPASLDARLAANRKGTIILAGSGPGSPELLTIATLTAIRTADVILADKLVPAPILDLIPRRTPVHIARKFPGNAEAAQDELLSMGLDALHSAKTVLRLKQGDPYLFGRGGEEFTWFRERGYKAIVLPGITSALSAPLFAQVPVTMRDVADQVLVCTGTGRKGAVPEFPDFKATRTVVFLMALHRLDALVRGLTSDSSSEPETSLWNTTVEEKAIGRSWPVSTPCTIIERASCRDQRVIRSTLEHICGAVEELGSRPPGLLVVGRACAALVNSKESWVVEEGFDGLGDLNGLGLGIGELGQLGANE